MQNQGDKSIIDMHLRKLGESLEDGMKRIISEERRQQMEIFFSEFVDYINGETENLSAPDFIFEESAQGDQKSLENERKYLESIEELREEMNRQKILVKKDQKAVDIFIDDEFIFRSPISVFFSVLIKGIFGLCNFFGGLLGRVLVLKEELDKNNNHDRISQANKQVIDFITEYSEKSFGYEDRINENLDRLGKILNPAINKDLDQDQQKELDVFFSDCINYVDAETEVLLIPGFIVETIGNEAYFDFQFYAERIRNAMDTLKKSFGEDDNRVLKARNKIISSISNFNEMIFGHVEDELGQSADDTSVSTDQDQSSENSDLDFEDNGLDSSNIAVEQHQPEYSDPFVDMDVDYLVDENEIGNAEMFWREFFSDAYGGEDNFKSEIGVDEIENIDDVINVYKGIFADKKNNEKLDDLSDFGECFLEVLEKYQTSKEIDKNVVAFTKLVIIKLGEKMENEVDNTKRFKRSLAFTVSFVNKIASGIVSYKKTKDVKDIYSLLSLDDLKKLDVLMDDVTNDELISMGMDPDIFDFEELSVKDILDDISEKKPGELEKNNDTQIQNDKQQIPVSPEPIIDNSDSKTDEQDIIQETQVSQGDTSIPTPPEPTGGWQKFGDFLKNDSENAKQDNSLKIPLPPEKPLWTEDFREGAETKAKKDEVPKPQNNIPEPPPMQNVQPKAIAPKEAKAPDPDLENFSEEERNNYKKILSLKEQLKVQTGEKDKNGKFKSKNIDTGFFNSIKTEYDVKKLTDEKTDIEADIKKLTEEINDIKIKKEKGESLGTQKIGQGKGKNFLQDALREAIKNRRNNIGIGGGENIRKELEDTLNYFSDFPMDKNNDGVKNFIAKVSDFKDGLSKIYKEFNEEKEKLDRNMANEKQAYELVQNYDNYNPEDDFDGEPQKPTDKERELANSYVKGLNILNEIEKRENDLKSEYQNFRNDNKDVLDEIIFGVEINRRQKDLSEKENNLNRSKEKIKMAEVVLDLKKQASESNINQNFILSPDEYKNYVKDLHKKEKINNKANEDLSVNTKEEEKFDSTFGERALKALEKAEASLKSGSNALNIEVTRRYINIHLGEPDAFEDMEKKLNSLGIFVPRKEVIEIKKEEKHQSQESEKKEEKLEANKKTEISNVKLNKEAEKYLNEINKDHGETSELNSDAIKYLADNGIDFGPNIRAKMNAIKNRYLKSDKVEDDDFGNLKPLEKISSLSVDNKNKKDIQPHKLAVDIAKAMRKNGDLSSLKIAINIYSLGNPHSSDLKVIKAAEDYLDKNTPENKEKLNKAIKDAGLEQKNKSEHEK